MASTALLIIGLLLLVGGAELLVRGAGKLALSLGISPLVVGLTIVSIGTSAPEVAISLGSALQGQADLALGNVLGSNIFNVLFILGVSAVILPLSVNAQIVRQEIPVMIGASLLLLPLMLDGVVNRWEGLLMLGLMAAYIVHLVRSPSQESAEVERELLDELPKDSAWDRHWAVQLLLIAGGLALLILGARWLVDAAVEIARSLGVSELVIGLTIVAAGTSAPEVATSVMAALRGQRDIAIGNVVGSNIFNILGCLGLVAAVAPGGMPVAPAALHFDYWVMLATALACLPVMLSAREIARWEGAVFVGYYVAYCAFLILRAQQHDALGAYSTAMLSFVVPLTIIAMVASLMKGQRQP
ncbi:MAG: calcium/sodium antiporter [Roseateles asaccharophilus]|uniref:calcium/sodium antiporter n=1 Tax=Roseateles asaccharophilus TaxID=582607 RepID=UPI00391C4342